MDEKLARRDIEEIWNEAGPRLTHESLVKFLEEAYMKGYNRHVCGEFQEIRDAFTHGYDLGYKEGKKNGRKIKTRA